tara:strand:- start:2278 stop:2469 length:192 start_codon:yes stop_codon:yes gene_type:complete
MPNGKEKETLEKIAKRILSDPMVRSHLCLDNSQEYKELKSYLHSPKVPVKRRLVSVTENNTQK